MSKLREIQCVDSFLNLLYLMIYLINSGKMAESFRPRESRQGLMPHDFSGNAQTGL